MSIFIFKNEEQLGPFSREELRTRLKRGEFATSNLAWAEGQSDWLPLEQLLELNQQNQSTPTPKATLSERIGLLGQNLKKSASLGGKQAAIAKLKMIDLPEAFQLLGQAAFDQRLFSDVHGEIYEKIAELNAEILNRKAETKSDPEGSLSDKAKQTAKRAGDLAVAEKLHLQRKRLLGSLGQAVLEQNPTAAELTTETTRVRSVHGLLEALEAELAALSSQTHWLLRKPLYLVIVLVVAVTLGYFGQNLYRSWASWQADLKAEAFQREVQIKMTRLKAEADAREAELQQKELQIAQENQRQREFAQQQAEEALERERAAKVAESQQREEARRVQREKEAAEKEAFYAKQEQSRIEHEQAEAARALAKVEAEKAQAEKNAARHVTEQKDRAAFCERVLSDLPLTPKGYISQPLRRLGTTVEVRGKGIEKLLELQSKKDWLGMLSAVAGTPYTEYPPASEIESLLGQISSLEPQYLIKTKFVATKDSDKITMFLFSPDDYYLVNEFRYLTQHPDGIGFITAWRRSSDRYLLVAGSQTQIYKGQFTFQKSAAEGVRALELKKKLGEIDEPAFKAARAKLQDDIFESMCHWADSLPAAP